MKRILIVRTDRLGDVVLSVPVIKNIRSNIPDSYLAFLATPYTRSLLEGNPDLDEVIIYDKKKAHRTLRSNLTFIKEIKAKKFDLALILHPTNRMHLITFLSGIPQRVGWNTKCGFLLTKRKPHTKHKGEKHEAEYNLELLEFAGFSVRSRELFIPVPENARQWLKGFLCRYAVGHKDRLLILGLGASCLSKIWPVDYYAELAGLLKKELGFRVVVLASGGERYLVKKFRELFEDEFIDLSGRLAVSQVSALLRRGDLFIGNDSGLAHIAAALGRKVIAIFGRNNPGISPRRWAPIGKYAVFMHKNAGCRKCLAHNCGKGFLCLKEIKPPDVFLRAKDLFLND